MASTIRRRPEAIRRSDRDIKNHTEVKIIKGLPEEPAVPDFIFCIFINLM